jgi:hypothetical protein
MHAQAEVVMRPLRFELRRLRGLRSIWTIIAVTTASSLVVTAAVAWFLTYAPAPAGGYSRADAATLTLSGPPFAALGAGILGAVIGGVDHRHRLNELSLLISPRRWALLCGKVLAASLVVGGVALVGLASALAVMLTIGLPDGDGRIGLSFWGPLVVGQTAKVLAWGLTGLLLGVALRSQAAAGIALVVGSSLVEPVVRSAVLAIPQGWWSTAPKFLPFAAFNGLVPTGSGTGSSIFAPTATLSVAGSLALSATYLAVLVFASYRSLKGRSNRSAGESMLVV